MRLPWPRLPAAIGLLLAGWPHAIAAAPNPSVEDLATATIRDLGLQVDLPRTPSLLPDLSISLPDILLWLVVAGLLGCPPVLPEGPVVVA